jgi:hypothetical protein
MNIKLINVLVTSYVNAVMNWTGYRMICTGYGKIWIWDDLHWIWEDLDMG